MENLEARCAYCVHFEIEPGALDTEHRQKAQEARLLSGLPDEILFRAYGKCMVERIDLGGHLGPVNIGKLGGMACTEFDEHGTPLFEEVPEG